MAPNVGLEAKVDDHTEPVVSSRQQTETSLEPLPRRGNTAGTQVLDVGQRNLMDQRLTSAPAVILDQQPPF